MSQTKKPTVLQSFATSGIGGVIGWIVVHPFNTIGVRMNLVAMTSGAEKVSFYRFATNTVKKEGVIGLYSGLGAGILRQVFYATSRLGLFELLRDELAKYRPIDFASRLFTGCISGGMAALISCPAEVTLVRMSNDNALPEIQRRNYKSVFNAFQRILSEEGVGAFFTGAGPFVNRAMLVGAVQVGTFDQFRESYRFYGIKNPTTNVFCASMTSGLIYALVTMPFESAKNRLATQRIDPVTGKMPYSGMVQVMRKIASTEGVFSLWNGFTPYYLRCGGHTVTMFMSVEFLRNMLKKYDI